jgi:hypothetical protein
MSQINTENQKKHGRCAGARTDLQAHAHRRSAVTLAARRARGTHGPRSARSQARAADAVINEYARGVATTRAARI